MPSCPRSGALTRAYGDLLARKRADAAKRAEDPTTTSWCCSRRLLQGRARVALVEAPWETRAGRWAVARSPWLTLSVKAELFEQVIGTVMFEAGARYNENARGGQRRIEILGASSRD